MKTIATDTLIRLSDGRCAVHLSSRCTFGASEIREDSMVLFPDGSFEVVDPDEMEAVEGVPPLGRATVAEEYQPYAQALATWRNQPGEVLRARLAEAGFNVLAPALFLKKTLPPRPKQATLLDAPTITDEAHHVRPKGPQQGALFA